MDAGDLGLPPYEGSQDERASCAALSAGGGVRRGWVFGAPQQIQLSRGDGLGAVAHVQLAVDLAVVPLDGADGEDGFLGDGAVAHALG